MTHSYYIVHFGAQECSQPDFSRGGTVREFVEDKAHWGAAGYITVIAVKKVSVRFRGGKDKLWCQLTPGLPVETCLIMPS